MTSPSLHVPPPPAITRAMLQPSIHARGARPFSFTGRVDEWHAPGAWTTRDASESRCAADAAWLVEKVLGAPRSQPHVWPGVYQAAERAKYFGAWQRRFVGEKLLALRNYQQDGAAFLAERDYAVLADWPGGGKTAQSLCAAEARLSLGVVPSNETPVVLVLAPALAKRNWQREIKKWTGHESVILDGTRPDPEQICARYVICNYDILYGTRRKDASGVVHDRQDLPGWGPTLANRFLIVIADELHILRGRTSRRAAAAKKMAHGVPVVWGLTGTLMPNYVRDLWSPLDFITDGLWGRYWDFVKKYGGAVQGQYGMIDTGASDLDELRARLGFFVLGRTAASVQLELPPMQRERYPIDVEFTAKYRHEGVEAKDRKTVVDGALRATARAKRPAVVEQAVEALNAQQKVVVFVYLREQCEMIARDIKDKVECPVMPVHGDMSPEGRDKVAQTFREANAPACFVATIDSVGMAISLVGADLVLFGDLVPEPWKMYQAELRCYRFDSTKSVLIRYLLATSTIDEHYAEAVIAKVENIESTMGAGGDQAALATSLGGRSSEQIVDGLFSKLLTMKGDSNG